MEKSNSGFVDLILWGLGLSFLSKVFSQDTKHTGCRFIFDETIRFKPIDAKRGKLACNGITNLSIIKSSFRVDTEIDTNTHNYRVTGYSIDFLLNMLINSEGMNNIIEFEKFYKPDRSYTIKDYVGNFNTSEGVKFHERLHFDGLRRVIESSKMQKEKQLMEIDIKKLRSNKRNELVGKVYAELYNYAVRIGEEEKKPLDAEKFRTRHQEIALEEWRFYHDQFKLMKDLKDIQK